VSRRIFSTMKAGLALAVIGLAAPAARAADPASPADQKARTVAALEQDVKTDPSNAELWLHLGFAYRKSEKIDQALEAFQKAAALNPRETDAFYMLALIYESKHDKPAAQKAWKDYLAGETDAAKRSVAEKHIHHLSQ
jgi:cytochrome c-type biogenesis protein CcmH/NrfG